MNCTAHSSAGNPGDKKTIRNGSISGVLAATLLKIALALTVATAQTALPAGLESPDGGVVCNGERAICYDRHGVSVGLTEAFLGHVAAERLTGSLHGAETGNRAKTTFSPVDGVDCVGGTGPCRKQLQPLALLTAVLFGQPSRPAGQTAEMRAIMYGEWDWQWTRYKNDTETRPIQPEHYVLRFEPDGSLSAQIDCNSAGGEFRFEENQITLKLINSTLMSCQQDSLEEVFHI